MSSPNDIVFLSATRTPMGGMLGSLASLTAPELAATAIRAAIERAGIEADSIDEGIMGCVLPAGVKQGPARQAMRQAGIPDGIGATTINKLCGSGMKAAMLAHDLIRAGSGEVILAGGMESMSNAPHAVRNLRNGVKMGGLDTVDTMVHDGLWDPYSNQHMGNCAEICAKEKGISRGAQDEFAAESYRRALAAQKAGHFKAER